MKKVLFVYSSITDSSLPLDFAPVLEYLRSRKIHTKLIDAVRHKHFILKKDITFTPIIIIKDGRKEERMPLMQGLKKVMLDDFSGRSLLHIMGFKAGRKLGHGLDCRTRSLLQKKLSALAIPDVDGINILKLDMKKKVAVLSISTRGPAIADDFIGAYLGGIFTEVFDKGVVFKRVLHNHKTAEFRTV